MAFQLFGVEIIGLRHVQMTSDIGSRLCLEHAAVEDDVVEELVVLFGFEVVHDREFGWVVLK